MNKTLKLGLIILVVGAVFGGSYALYLFNMPHRDVQGEEATFNLEAEELVNEFIANPSSSNTKYLDKVVIVTGKVTEISEDQLGNKVVLLKTEKAGINCTFMQSTNKNTNLLVVNDSVKIKGIINLGPSYDEDLEEAEYGVLEKCDIAKLLYLRLKYLNVLHRWRLNDRKTIN